MSILRVTHIVHRAPFLPKWKINTTKEGLVSVGVSGVTYHCVCENGPQKREKQEIQAICQSQHLCVLSALWGSVWQLLERSLSTPALRKGHWERVTEAGWLMAQAAWVEASRVGGDLRVQAMDAALHLSRHGPLLELQLSRVHHRATQHRKQAFETQDLEYL